MLMTARDGSRALNSDSNSLVDGLARSVISKVNATPHQRRNRRIEIGSKILSAAVLDGQGFDQDTVKSDLAALRITPTDIVDHCIPEVARELGADWVADRLSFAEVTVASSRLYGLCKSIGQDWDNIRPRMNARRLLLVTVDREDHILGPAVLADQLRRRGHSVMLHSNATGQSIAGKLSADEYDGVLVSVATFQALEKAPHVIKDVKRSFPRTMVVLGGVATQLREARLVTTGADLVTNNIDDALDSLSGSDLSLRVAE